MGSLVMVGSGVRAPPSALRKAPHKRGYLYARAPVIRAGPKRAGTIRSTDRVGPATWRSEMSDRHGMPQLLAKWRARGERGRKRRWWWNGGGGDADSPEKIAESRTTRGRDTAARDDAYRVQGRGRARPWDTF